MLQKLRVLDLGLVVLACLVYWDFHFRSPKPKDSLKGVSVQVVGFLSFRLAPVWSLLLEAVQIAVATKEALPLSCGLKTWSR